MAEDEGNGWTWDDPTDVEGDNLWDEEWVAPEYDATLTGRVNATWNALMTHVAPQATNNVVQGKQLVRAGLSQVQRSHSTGTAQAQRSRSASRVQWQSQSEKDSGSSVHRRAGRATHAREAVTGAATGVTVTRSAIQCGDSNLASSRYAGRSVASSGKGAAHNGPGRGSGLECRGDRRR
eukprot:9296465-Pyramimonas_sp.AAC.1